MLRSSFLAVLLAVPLLTAGIAMADDHPVHIAFVDTGNTGRSVTAEALALATISKDKLNAKVISRGIDMDPYDVHPEPNFVTLLQDRGIDVSKHTAAQFARQDAKHADLVLTMTEKHKAWVMSHYPDLQDKVFTLAAYATGKPEEVLDAYGKPMDFYKTVLAQLDQLVAAAVTKAAVKP